jgi:hypothetical protein
VTPARLNPLPPPMATTNVTPARLIPLPPPTTQLPPSYSPLHYFNNEVDDLGDISFEEIDNAINNMVTPSIDDEIVGQDHPDRRQAGDVSRVRWTDAEISFIRNWHITNNHCTDVKRLRQQVLDDGLGQRLFHRHHISGLEILRNGYRRMMSKTACTCSKKRKFSPT